jgi:hypothetical protein
MAIDILFVDVIRLQFRIMLGSKDLLITYNNSFIDFTILTIQKR